VVYPAWCISRLFEVISKLGKPPFLTCSFQDLFFPSYSISTMILFPSLIFLIALGAIVFLHLHKRASKVKSPLSSPATVHTTLGPEGSVLVHGELWLAQSLDGNIIPEKKRVTVAGLRDHLLLVNQVSDEL
jgi:membrane-bound serine protease (ClpP class)